MPKVFVPWGEFRPDLGEFRQAEGSEASLVMGSKNFLAHGRSYLPAPVPLLLPNSTIGAAFEPTESAVLPLGDADWKIYVGSKTQIHEYDPSGVGAVTDVSGATYTNANWRSTVFGDNVIFTNGVDPMRLKTPAAANFAALVAGASPFTPTAKHVSTFRQHLLIGNYAEGGTTVPHGVWWSATNDATTWGTSTSSPGKNTDRQPLGDDLGPVEGLIDMGEFALILRQKGVTRMDGLPSSFRNLDTSGGTRYGRSLVALAGVAYWMSPGGIHRCDGQSVDSSFANDKVNRLLVDPAFSPNPVSDDPLGPNAVYGFSDAASRSVGWVWRSGTFTYMLTHHVDSGRFSWLTTDAVNNESGRYWRALTSRPFVSDEWFPLSQVVFVHVDGTTYRVADFDNAIGMTSTFKTGLMQHDEERRVIYEKVRPIIRLKDGVTDPPAMQVTARSTSTPWDSSPTEVASTTQDRDGAFLFDRTLPAGDFNGLSVRFGPAPDVDPVDLGIAEYEGVEITYRLEGDR